MAAAPFLIKQIMDAKNWSNMTFKDKLSSVLCVASFTSGIALIIASMFIPPHGVIDTSVLTALGMLLTWSGSIIGISQHYGNELERIKSEINKRV